MIYAEMVNVSEMMKVVFFKKLLGYMKELIDSPSFRLNPKFCQHLGNGR